MSADDFQTKYASVMEGMLKSAIAETTKLFENMVDELKAEISQIRKENEDLKKKCFQYETARKKPVKPAAESSAAQERSDVSEKCDSAVQCDIVPYCTVLVEECRSLMGSTQQNQGHQCAVDSMGQNFQDHNYFKSTNPEMSVVLVKQEELDNVSFEFALKQEKADNDVVSGKILTNKSIRTSTRAQHEKHRISQESSADQISSPRKKNKTSLGCQMPCLGNNGSSQGVHSHSPEINHSIVISLKDALRDDIKVESEDFQKKTELGAPGKLATSGKRSLIPQRCHMDSAFSISEETIAIVEQHFGVHTVSVPEVKAIIKPATRRKGRLPKKTPKKSFPSPVTGVSSVSDNLTIPVTEQADIEPSLPVVKGKVSLLESSKASPSEFIKTLCLVPPVVEDGANILLESRKGKIGSLPTLVEPHRCSLLYKKLPTVHSLQNSTEVEDRADAQSFENSLESQTPLAPHGELRQAPLDVHRKCRTPVSLQDALLLVDAMNQSSIEHTITPSQITPQPQVLSASPISPSETSATQQTTPVEAQPTVKILDASAHSTVETLDQNLFLIPKQPQQAPSHNTPTLPVSSSVPLVSATETVEQPHPLPQINLAATSNIPRKIIIVKRPSLSKTSKCSEIPLSSVDSMELLEMNQPSKADSTDLLEMNPPSKADSTDLLEMNPPSKADSTDLLEMNPPSKTDSMDLLETNPPSKTDSMDLLETNPPSKTDSMDLLETNPPSKTDSTDLLEINLPSKADSTDLLEINPPSKADSTDLLEMNPPSKADSTDLLEINPPSKADSTDLLDMNQPSKADSKDLLKISPSPSSCVKPVIPAPQKSTKVTVQKLDPILPLQPTTIAAHRKISPCPNITVNLIQVPTDAFNRPVFAKKQDTTVPATSVSPQSPQLRSTLKESRLSTAENSLLAKEINNKTHPLDSPNLTTFACATNISPTELDLSSETVEPVQMLVSADLQPAAKQKLCAVVRLVRLPPSVSTQKSVSISRLQKDQAWGLFKKMSAMPSDKSDPRLQMTKARFTEQASTTSLQNKVGSNKRSAANETKTGTKNAKRPQLKRRRRYVKNKTKTATKSKIVQICKAKVWYPPKLPPNEVPIVDKIPEPRLMVEFRIPVIPAQRTPMVSPLQPLAVIGRHLLRNQCGECGRVFETTTALESHVSLHKIYRPFTCKLCGKPFPDAKTFKRHDRVHRNGRIHLCPLCGKGFVYRYAVGKHIQMVHRKLKPFICQICNKEFYNKLDVEGHIRSHTGERPYKCDLCDRRFIRRIELNLHLRWHRGEKRHWCPYCGKGFLDGNNLKRHKLTHTGEKPHSCPHCPKKFTQSAHLKKHVSTVHKDKTK